MLLLPQSHWRYEKGGTDFDAKLGALLANGADLQVGSHSRHSAGTHALPCKCLHAENPATAPTFSPPSDLKVLSCNTLVGTGDISSGRSQQQVAAVFWIWERKQAQRKRQCE